MAEETYVATYKGHVVYYFRYREGGTYNIDGGPSYFKTMAEAYAAIDKMEVLPPTPPVEPQAPSAPSEITLPWPWDWVAGPLNWLGSFFNWIVTQIASPISGIGSSIALLYERLGGKLDAQEVATNAINSTLKGVSHQISQELIDNIGNIMTNALDTQLKQTLLNLPEALSHSPEWKTQIEGVLDQYSNDLVRPIEPLIPSEVPKTPETPQKTAADKLMTLKIGVSAAVIATWVGSVIAEAAGFGQLETVAKLCDIEMNLLGFAYVGNQAVQIPLENEIMIRARQFWAAQYTPEIPGYGDLQNMRMKEIIGQTEFEDMLKYHGYAPEWARKMWDAHFIPPSLNDILTAWRRQIPVSYPKSDPATGTIVWVRDKKLDETDVRYLLESIDLDPRYIEIYETRKYVDPPLNITRFMFEEGVIGPGIVRDLVALQGYRPEHVDYITKYITEFQERLWRRRYLVTLQGGYQKGVYSGEELNKAVLDAGYTQDVATWIRANADARKKIAEAEVVKVSEPKLIGVGDLKKAYVRNMIDADKLRIDLQVRGYQTSDVDLLVKLLDEEKVVTSAGGEKVALSVPEIKAAWKYGKVTEDYVRIELQLRGLSLEEVEILISTWKAQLGVEGETPGG